MGSQKDGRRRGNGWRKENRARIYYPDGGYPPSGGAEGQIFSLGEVYNDLINVFLHTYVYDRTE